MKRFGLQTLAFLMLSVLIEGCASQTDVATDQSSTQSAGTVPGEKVSGEGGLTPGAGPGGANASVHW